MNQVLLTITQKVTFKTQCQSTYTEYLMKDSQKVLCNAWLKIYRFLKIHILLGTLHILNRIVLGYITF